MSQTLSRSAEILKNLIRCPSITPEEGGALSYLQEELEALGFDVERVTFSDSDTPDVENLYARFGKEAPHVMFAGHTDVVPPGNEADWQFKPFDGKVSDGLLYGRGAVDMKGGIACFLAAAENLINDTAFNGSVSFLITGDEEGPSINGTDKLLRWAADKGEHWDAAIVGEPSNPDAIGDAIKIGRRGSLSGILTVNGVQGHAAYPHLADNPIPGLVDLLNALLGEPFDEGSDAFQPTNLEVTTIDAGNPATNVVPAKITAGFNIRFNDGWDGDTVKAEILRRLQTGADAFLLRDKEKGPLSYSVKWIGRVSPVFLTRDDKLIGQLRSAIEKVTGKHAELTTGGGTSDARFIKDYCSVVEFGLVGQTMHKVDEFTSLQDLDTLTEVYSHFLKGYFNVA